MWPHVGSCIAGNPSAAASALLQTATARSSGSTPAVPDVVDTIASRIAMNASTSSWSRSARPRCSAADSAQSRSFICVSRASSHRSSSRASCIASHRSAVSCFARISLSRLWMSARRWACCRAVFACSPSARAIRNSPRSAFLRACPSR